jgi:hypothetical protein
MRFLTRWITAYPAWRVTGIDCVTPTLVGLRQRIAARNVRRDTHASQLSDEDCRIVALIGPERETPYRTRKPALDHVNGRLALGCLAGLCQTGLHDEARPVLQKGMAQEAVPCSAPVALADELRIGIRRLGVRLILAALAVEVFVGVAARAGRLVGAVLRMAQDRVEKLRRRASIEEPVALLRERRVVSQCIIQPEPTNQR